jgi:hypothetical protein
VKAELLLQKRKDRDVGKFLKIMDVVPGKCGELSTVDRGADNYLVPER